jgi:hypothetical protein
MKKKPAKAKTHFVPRVVYRTAFAGVVPVCVAGVACGGRVLDAGGDGDSGAGATNVRPGSSGAPSDVDSGFAGQSAGNGFVGGVGCAGFCGGVGTQAFDAGWDGVATMAFADAGDALFFSVACVGFDGGLCGEEALDAVADSPKDAAPNDAKAEGASGRDATLSVACAGFCGVSLSGFGDGGDSG